ncbi:MAG: hypothetical protein KA007_01045 [Candidatus Pacebacteria bacterium]|jgi:hypothetical protein|nr:hypothetical protein [Candidatus Paceibacterota bacterium]
MNNKDSLMGEVIKKDYLLPISFLISSLVVAGAWIYTSGLEVTNNEQIINKISEVEEISVLEGEVLPSTGVTLPVVWGDIGSQLVSSGAIDANKFRSIYEGRGGFTQEYEELLSGNSKNQLKITKENSGYLLNLLWALGLANKNPILDFGEVVDPKYGGAENFASTGGWVIAQGNPMNHYSKHSFLELTTEQQGLVDKISKGIYRPCCNNSTHFPDCNHGMAMLGFLELMASQGIGEKEMWQAALAVNSYWFPDTYLTIATYMKDQGVDWQDVNPEEILGANYSSISGYKAVASRVSQPTQSSGGGGCGVDAGVPAPKRQTGGCGI